MSEKLGKIGFMPLGGILMGSIVKILGLRLNVFVVTDSRSISLIMLKRDKLTVELLDVNARCSIIFQSVS